MSTEKARKITQDLLGLWSDDLFLAGIGVAHSELGNNNIPDDELESTRVRLLDAVQAYVTALRLHYITGYFNDLCGGIGNSTPAQAEFLDAPMGVRVRLNQITGHYGLHRAFLHLHLYAHVLHGLTMQGFLDLERTADGATITIMDEMNDLLDRLDPR